MRRDVYRKAVGACVAAILILTGTRSLAAPSDRPAIVGTIEQNFNGFFLLVTNGNGHYDIFQKVDDGLGVPENANLVCMPRDMCFLEIGHMPPNVIAIYGEEGRTVGGLRYRLAAVRDTYALMHSAPPEKRQAGIDAWRQAISNLAACLENNVPCP